MKQTLSQFRATRISVPSTSREALKLYNKLGEEGPLDPEAVTTHFYHFSPDIEKCPSNASAAIRKAYKKGYQVIIEYAPDSGFTYEWGQGGDSVEPTRARAERALFNFHSE